jgi:hypothetical protein
VARRPAYSAEVDLMLLRAVDVLRRANCRPVMGLLWISDGSGPNGPTFTQDATFRLKSALVPAGM